LACSPRKKRANQIVDAPTSLVPKDDMQPLAANNEAQAARAKEYDPV